MPGTTNGWEPRGDLDVILSMRAQGLISSPVSPFDNSNGHTLRGHGPVSPTHSTFTTESNQSSPVSLLSRSHSNSASNTYSTAATSTLGGESALTDATSHAGGSNSPTPRASISATTALKSLFTIGGTRPRSPSSASFTPPPAAGDDDHDVHPEDSFGHAGTSLMGMVRSNSYVSDRPITPAPSTIHGTSRVGTPIIPSETHPYFLERKILPDSDRHLMVDETDGEPIMLKRPNTNSLGLGRPRDIDERFIPPGRVSSEGIASVALQPPPPRKRAGTVNTVTVSVSSPPEAPSSYSYAHANSSTAESLGVSLGVRNSSLLTPPVPVTPLASTTRPKDRRTRASWSSASTYASGEQSPSSPDEAKSRRWSRRSSLPQRMSPPYPLVSSPPSSPKSQEIRAPSFHHPYASESNSLSRSSSLGSGRSRMSELNVRPFSSKRASASSMQGSSTSHATQTSAVVSKPILASVRQRTSHRASMPPPQRPAPNVALPPTPAENGANAAPSTTPSPPTQSLSTPKTFRESLTLRGNKRLSTSPPTLPPSFSLPPRPDEPGYRPPVNAHRRSSSQGNPNPLILPANSIPSALIQNQTSVSPPNLSLPPPPSSPTRPTSMIKRRLRILSSPPTSPPKTAPPMPPVDVDPDSSFNPISIPESPINNTPIGEPITTLQNNPNFLLMSPPTPPRLSFIDDTPQGLSPPPRRSSRQVSTPDTEKEAVQSVSVDLVVGESCSDDDTADFARAPPPEVDDFAPLLAPTVRSSDFSAVSLVDVRI